MPLNQYAENHPNQGIRFIPFQQDEPHCLGLSAAWLRWFHTAKKDDLLAGRFDPYSRRDMILSLQQDGALPAYQSANYISQLYSRLLMLGMRVRQFSSTDYPSIPQAVQLEGFDYNKMMGGLLFGLETTNDPQSPGHAMSFGVRRFNSYDDDAFFGFFDANQGMLIMKLENFPPTKNAWKTEIDLVNDTTHVVSTFQEHMKGLNQISSFFEEIQSEYPYQKYHCDNVFLLNTTSPQSPVMFTRKLSTSISPKSPARSNINITPKSPDRMRFTVETSNSIKKYN
jgi:hypothetical protein